MEKKETKLLLLFRDLLNCFFFSFRFGLYLIIFASWHFLPKNVVQQFARNHQRCFHIQHASTPVFKNSFFPRTIREWNNLDSSVVSAGTVGEF